MQRSRILAIVLVTAIVALLAGTAIGYYRVPDSKGPSAECVVVANDLANLTNLNPEGSSVGESPPQIQRILDYYDEHCR